MPPAQNRPLARSAVRYRGDALGHNYEDGICTVCGFKDPDYTLPASEGLTFASWGDGTCEVTGPGTCTDTDLVIPATSPDGDKVVGIGLWAFANDKITSVVIPEGVTYIGQESFSKCKELESITIPASVKEIGSGAFFGCDSISKVYISDLKAWCKIQFNDGTYGPCTPMTYGHADLYLNGELLTDLVIPSGITALQSHTFHGCGSIVSVTIPDKVTSIGNSTFVDCGNLVSVTMPDKITSIGAGAFCDCDSLVNITIPKGVTSIGGFAFSGCDSLVDITIPQGVTSIGEHAFYDCQKLTSVTFCPEQMPTLGENLFLECPALQAIIVPDALANQYMVLPDWTEYADKIRLQSSGEPVGSFGSVGLEFISNDNGTCKVSGIGTCTDTVIVIPEASPAGDQVVAIDAEAFLGCSQITGVVIPATVAEIGVRAFQNCSSLTDLDIPASVTILGTSMIYGCSSLTTLTLRSATVLNYPAPPDHAEDDTYDRVTVYVPAELVESYRAAYGWMPFEEKIQPISE